MVEGFKIEGGRELNGIIEVSGAKNAALPIVIATLVEASYEIVKQMRASFLVMGPMIANLKESVVSLPGGCAIGSRPVDIHLKGFEALGAEITQIRGYVHVSAENLRGADIAFNFPSVGATQNILMAAVKIPGTTRIINAAREPEVVDLGKFLIKMGAKIEGLGTNTITIEGVEKLHATEYSIMPDRIEAGTYVIASILTKGDLKIKNANIEELGVFKQNLESMGVEFIKDGDILTVKGKVEDLKPTRIVTMPHPGFPTDMQAQTMLLLSMIKGHSEVEETVFENRFMHVPEFNRMGTNISIRHGIANVEGVDKLYGTNVMASDLRAGAALVVAGLIADGETILSRIYHIDRGYDKLEDKLNKVGAKIERIKLEV